MKVTIIIPCFNEYSTITKVLDRVRRLDLPDGLTKEIIVVDDGSSDGSGDLLRRYVDQNADVRLHISTVNFGKGTAVRIGLALTTGDIIVIQDADLELRPEEIPNLVAPILAGRSDVVFGSRFLGNHKFRWTPSYLANRFLIFLTRMLYMTRITDMETCYKVFRRTALANVRLCSVGFEIEPELTAKFLRQGHTIHEVPITYIPRTNAEGKKIRAWDGVKAIYYLIKYRQQPLSRFVVSAESGRSAIRSAPPEPVASAPAAEPVAGSAPAA